MDRMPESERRVVVGRQNFWRLQTARDRLSEVAAAEHCTRNAHRTLAPFVPLLSAPDGRFRNTHTFTIGQREG